MTPARRAIVAIHLLCVAAVCIWVPWRSRLPQSEGGGGDFYLGYGFWWSPPEPPPDYVRLARDRNVTCEAPAPVLSRNPPTKDASDPVASILARRNSRAQERCSVSSLGNIEPFLRRLSLSEQDKEAAWAAFYGAASPAELDAALAQLPLRTEDRDAVRGARWQLARPEGETTGGRSDVEAIMARLRPSPPAEPWKDEDLLAQLRNPKRFRILLPDLAGGDDSERRNLDRYDRDRTKGITREVYRFSRIDLNVIALEIAALSAFAGLGFIFAGRSKAAT